MLTTHNLIEAFGILAALIVLASMCYNTNTYKGSLFMRILNLLGSFAYVIYGICIKSASVLILNGALVIINGYYLYKLLALSKKGISGFKERQQEQIQHVKEHVKNKKKSKQNAKKKSKQKSVKN